MARKKQSTPDFESAVKELEELVESMEHGELSLEESLKRFERGVELTRICQEALKNAEQKVQQVVEREGGSQLEPVTQDPTDNRDE